MCVLERHPRTADAQALPWEALLQTIWLKVLKRLKSRQMGKRHLKGTPKRLTLPDAYG